jgi:NAD(P)H-hydrate repair Nnr-like enzyme with NAD(P)H-hydrate epimerase domain
MNAQREVTEASGGEGAVAASFLATDCLRISVTLKLHPKMRHRDAFAKKKCLQVTLLPALHERKLGFLDF